MQTQVQVLTLFAMEVPTSMGRVAFIRACLGEHWTVTLFIGILQFVFSKWTQTPLISTELWHSTWIGGATFYALGSVRWNCINRRLQSFSLWKKSTFLQFEEVIHMLNADKYIFAFGCPNIYLVKGMKWLHHQISCHVIWSEFTSASALDSFNYQACHIHALNLISKSERGPNIYIWPLYHSHYNCCPTCFWGSTSGCCRWCRSSTSPPSWLGSRRGRRWAQAASN